MCMITACLLTNNVIHIITHYICMYSTALMKRRTYTTLFLDSTDLLEQSTFEILEKIARVANDTQLRSFHDNRLLNRL